MKYNAQAIGAALNELRNAMPNPECYEIGFEYGKVLETTIPPFVADDSTAKEIATSLKILANEVVLVSYDSDVAFFSVENDEAELDDKAVFFWENALACVEAMASTITIKFREVSEDEKRALPSAFFVEETGDTIALELLEAFEIAPNVSVDEVPDQSSDWDDYIEGILGGDNEEVSIYVADYKLPNGDRIRGSISRSRPVEKSKHVTAFHHLVPV